MEPAVGLLLGLAVLVVIGVIIIAVKGKSAARPAASPGPGATPDPQAPPASALAPPAPALAPPLAPPRTAVDLMRTLGQLRDAAADLAATPGKSVAAVGLRLAGAQTEGAATTIILKSGTGAMPPGARETLLKFRSVLQNTLSMYRMSPAEPARAGAVASATRALALIDSLTA